MPEPLLRTKLFAPPTQPQRATRPRLLERATTWGLFAFLAEALFYGWLLVKSVPNPQPA